MILPWTLYIMKTLWFQHKLYTLWKHYDLAINFIYYKNIMILPWSCNITTIFDKVVNIDILIFFSDEFALVMASRKDVKLLRNCCHGDNNISFMSSSSSSENTPVKDHGYNSNRTRVNIVMVKWNSVSCIPHLCILFRIN